MNNQIDALLGEIEKFKKNVTNSNELLDLLNISVKKIEEQEGNLHSSHEKIENLIEKKFLEIDQRVLELDLKIIDASSSIKIINDLIVKINSRLVILYGLLGGSFILLLVNLVLTLSRYGTE